MFLFVYVIEKLWYNSLWGVQNAVLFWQFMTCNVTIS